ncbi:MAG: sulfatase-like hydrolase/transferase, partial [Bacteroidales bacterium]|nr:sulfatase-like hydrolase/transferase [Bacteroidales bacterium]
MNFVKFCFSITVMFTLFACKGNQGSTEKSQSKNPNIIFVMVDDMGYGDLGCYGQTEIKTPNIDHLASEGIQFTNFYSGSPVCAPARSVLMTGQHTGHTTVRGNFGIGGVTGLGGGEGRVPLKKEDVTIAEVFKKAGYVTGMTGKWGLGEPE